MRNGPGSVLVLITSLLVSDNYIFLIVESIIFISYLINIKDNLKVVFVSIDRYKME